jgi:hypothetical protein
MLILVLYYLPILDVAISCLKGIVLGMLVRTREKKTLEGQ